MFVPSKPRHINTKRNNKKYLAYRDEVKKAAEKNFISLSNDDKWEIFAKNHDIPLDDIVRIFVKQPGYMLLTNEQIEKYSFQCLKQQIFMNSKEFSLIEYVNSNQRTGEYLCADNASIKINRKLFDYYRKNPIRSRFNDLIMPYVMLYLFASMGKIKSRYIVDDNLNRTKFMSTYVNKYNLTKGHIILNFDEQIPADDDYIKENEKQPYKLSAMDIMCVKTPQKARRIVSNLIKSQVLSLYKTIKADENGNVLEAEYRINDYEGNNNAKGYNMTGYVYIPYAAIEKLTTQKLSAWDSYFYIMLNTVTNDPKCRLSTYMPVFIPDLKNQLDKPQYNIVAHSNNISKLMGFSDLSSGRKRMNYLVTKGLITMYKISGRGKRNEGYIICPHFFCSLFLNTKDIVILSSFEIKKYGKISDKVVLKSKLPVYECNRQLEKIEMFKDIDLLNSEIKNLDELYKWVLPASSNYGQQFINQYHFGADNQLVIT